MIIEYEIVFETESENYNADFAEALTQLATNTSITINNQTAKATGIAVEGAECMFVFCLFMIYTCIKEK